VVQGGSIPPLAPRLLNFQQMRCCMRDITEREELVWSLWVKGMKQSAIAKQLGVSETRISQICSSVCMKKRRDSIVTA